MPRSSGTYTLPAGNPVVTGTTITSTWANTTFSDVATALTGSVATDGTSPMTGILQMGNNKITGVADGTASSDVATVNQISNPTITGGTIDGAPIGAANPRNGAFLAISATTAAFSGTSTAPTVTPSSDNSTKIATTAFVQSAITAISSGVTSFNTRSGVVTLTSGDVVTALGFTPYNAGGSTVVTSGNINTYAPTLSGTGAVGTWGISISGNAATASTATTATNLSGGTVSATTVSGTTITGSGIVSSTASGGYSALQNNAIGIGTSANTISSTSGGNVFNFNVAGSPAAALAASQFVPTPDNTLTLGSAGLRWTTVYATTGTINTSDRNSKQQISNLTPAEKAVGQSLKGMIVAFKFTDAVLAKGPDARTHFGVIAQDVKAAFEAQGLNAEDYGVFCSDTLPNGDVRLGVRYEELFSLIVGSL
jgi:hypothetical protein